jgi:predicted transcriptional regulator
MASENNEQEARIGLLGLTTDIVSAHISNNAISAADLPLLIQRVFATLNGLGNTMVEAPVEERNPAVPVRRSVTPDYIVCLEDGKKLKMLKRHLRTSYDMTPDEYRVRWKLPADYPMVAPNYAAKRKELALRNGLGRKPAAAVIKPVGRPRKKPVAKNA